MVRTASLQSTSRGSPSASTMNKQRPQKAHTVGHSRLHARTASYGKNLHKLTKQTGEDSETQEQAQKSSNQSPPMSPSTAQHLKRNSSTVSLPRTGSKVSIKKNTSNVSLKRNTSSTHVNRSRPTTPLRKNNSRASQLDKLRGKNKAQFTIDAGDEAEEDADQEDEWTEESSSPNITRSNSVSKGNRSRAHSPPPPAVEHIPNGTRLPYSPPESPITEDVPAEQPHTNGFPQPPRLNPRRTPAQANVDAITSRLLSGQASSRLSPEVTSISVNGIPGTQTPPLGNNYDSFQTPGYTPSLPSNGVSRFLHAPTTSSASASTRTSAFPDHALAYVQTPPLAQRTSTFSTLSSRAPSPSNESSDAIRRAKSIPNLSTKQRTPTITKDAASKLSREAPETDTFEPPPRLAGGKTQAKLNLWRDHERVEPLHGPPPTLMHRAPPGILGTEERRIRLWEGAEAELSHLKRFRNPIVESARRAIKSSGRGKEKKRTRERDGEGGLAIRAAQGRQTGGSGHPGSYIDSVAENGSAGSRRTFESEVQGTRPPSQAGSRNVRFEVGGGDEPRNREQNFEDGNGVEELLRRLWIGGEGDVNES